MEKKKLTKSNIYMIACICILLLAVAGSAYAYYSASATGNIVGEAAGAGLNLTIEKLSNTDGSLIPLDNTPDMLTKAAKGYGNNGSTFDKTKSCIDKNGYTVCQVYKITLSNTSTIPITVNGGVTLYGGNTPNIECSKMVNSTSVTDNTSCKGSNTLANNYTLNANSSNDYYIIVYINNLNYEQEDAGVFYGEVTFTSITGAKLKAKFTEDVPLTTYITNLYNNASKTVVTNNNIEYNYATSVNLMNDRLGGTTTNYDGGNIRYYGVSPNNYIDIGDYHKNENYDACYEEVNNKLSSYGYTYETSKDFCNSNVKGYTLFETKNIDDCISNLNCDNLTGEDKEKCNNELSNILTLLNANNAEEACGTNIKAYHMFEKTNKEECISYLNCSNWSENGFGSEEECNDVRKFLFKIFNTDNVATACNSDVKGYMLKSDSPEACYDNYKCDELVPTLYRIIGVFKDITLSDGTKKDLIKIIRNESIGNYSWDTSYNPITGINEWSQADAMKLLNPGYENNKDLDSDGTQITVNNSLWWNSQSGTCYSGERYATTTCDFINTGLSGKAKNNIASVVWNTSVHGINSVYPNQIYTYERANNIIQNPYDGITRNTTWTGKVALMYPSDYGYGTDFNSCRQTLANYDNTNCKSNDWLFNNNYQWLLMPHSSSGNIAWNIRPTGSVNRLSFASNTFGLRPTFYLKDDVVIEGGTGTENDPYRLG